MLTLKRDTISQQIVGNVELITLPTSRGDSNVSLKESFKQSPYMPIQRAKTPRGVAAMFEITAHIMSDIIEKLQHNKL